MKIRERIDDKVMDKVSGGIYNSDNINLGNDVIVSLRGSSDISVRQGAPMDMGQDILLQIGGNANSLMGGASIDTIGLGESNASIIL